MYQILTLNNISAVGLEKFPTDLYQISDDVASPDAIILRSFKMHDMPIPASLKAVGRAGAGVNNIPLDAMSKAGIPVFNAPGANANAVKELVIASLFLSARNISEAIKYTEGLQGEDAELGKLVEAGKKKYAGFELPGRTIGVVGLGAIGRMVANTCVNLGMNVVGFDPGLTVDGAWQLSAQIERANSVDEMLSKVDFLTVHVPLIDATRDLINADNVQKMKPTAVVINLARGGIINDAAVCDAIDAGKLGCYVTDFPNNRTKQTPKVIGLPHLGASTGEAEDNCAVMVANQVRDYLETGNITNSVNFPNVSMPRGTDHRLVVCNQNVPNMVGQISTILADANLNINDMINQSRGDVAYTIVDVDSAIPSDVISTIKQLDGVMIARTIQA
ncbi:D-3-phosphoglycerate dehydrogenase [Arenicella chitinivorans]|uniref:D-3-phosphoglycerate dehydrogenase n=1 Tax=Arenicella chitinivorans TaxID=1329800 RepID=A0A918VIR5_9GAMM|nr:phosphoglycerate dehydrogenase [Arenicella chitinivorans]GGZ99398.1 D-3-phosphoglycerate dehydrogenase [Arenicella chitinivorans]